MPHWFKSAFKPHLSLKKRFLFEESTCEKHMFCLKLKTQENLMDGGLISKLTGSVRSKLPFVRHFGTSEIRIEVIAVPS